MKILVIDDHRLFAHGLKLALQELFKDIVIVEAYTAQRALGLIDGGESFDLILTDLQMPGFGGHELVQSFGSRKLRTPVAVISASESLSDMKRAHQLGAKGYIFKSEPAFDLVPKIQDLLDGKESYPDVFWRALVDDQTISEARGEIGIEGLGKRPIEVLHLLAQGKSNKQIAAILSISETTVKFHIRTLFSALGVNNRTWCVREAERRGIINNSDL